MLLKTQVESEIWTSDGLTLVSSIGHYSTYVDTGGCSHFFHKATYLKCNNEFSKTALCGHSSKVNTVALSFLRPTETLQIQWCPNLVLKSGYSREEFRRNWAEFLVSILLFWLWPEPVCFYSCWNVIVIMFSKVCVKSCTHSTVHLLRNSNPVFEPVHFVSVCFCNGMLNWPSMLVYHIIWCFILLTTSPPHMYMARSLNVAP